MRFSTETAGLLALIGFAVCAFGTLIGAGGGFVLTPILLLLYPHDSAQTLTAISLTAVFFNAVSGSAAYARQRRIDYRSGTVFALATLPGAIGGAIVVGSVSRQLFDALMGAMLALLAVWLLAGERWPLPTPRPHLEQRTLVDRAGETYTYTVPLRRGAINSLAVGFVSSFLGIGGGVIHLPLLVRALASPPTSRSAASPTATASGAHSHSRSASSPAPNSARVCRCASAAPSSNGSSAAALLALPARLLYAIWSSCSERFSVPRAARSTRATAPAPANARAAAAHRPT